MTIVSNKLNGSTAIDNINEDVALDIGDVIEVCKSYNRLGWNIQQQIEWLIELGIEEAIKEKKVSIDALPHIRDFLESITKLMVGDTIVQAIGVIMMIDNYELKHPHLLNRESN